MGYIRNAVLINAPIDDVFTITNNVRAWPELFTEYASCEVLEETGNTVTFRLTTRPDEQGRSWSWVSKRHTDVERKSTLSERLPSDGPFQHMLIRWWYNSVGVAQTAMTWEQEFSLKEQAPITEQQATHYLNAQTRIQQQAIKKQVEMLCGSTTKYEYPARGVIVGRYQVGSEQAIINAFQKSDQTELPQLLHVKSRHVWVLGDIYIHFVESETPLPSVLKEYSNHPLFREIKSELDTYVKPLSPELYPGVGKEIYRWFNDTQKAENRDA